LRATIILEGMSLPLSKYINGGGTTQGGDAYLDDGSKTGRRRKHPWRQKKIASLRLSEIYERLGREYEGKRARVSVCADYLDFKRGADGVLHLHRAGFCHVRLCPMCSMRRSRKVFGQVSRIMDHMDSHGEYKYIFLTLTVRNMPGEGLNKAFDMIFDGLHEFCRNKRVFGKAVAGWFRALEVTHNWETNEYHPHVHMILAVRPGYLTRKENYVCQKCWRRLWAKSIGVAYDPWVDVRIVRQNARKGDEVYIKKSSAVAEVAKYTVKETDFLKVWQKDENGHKVYLAPRTAQEREAVAGRIAEAVCFLDGALARRRLVAFGGEMGDAHRQLSLDDPIDGDLKDTHGDVRGDVAGVIERYRWCAGVGNYVLVRGK